jgi:hypothetical protein
VYSIFNFPENSVVINRMLPNGLYFLRINSTVGMVTKKVVVMSDY